MNKILLILFLLLLNSCGYTSIYKNQKSNNFQININEMSGDSAFNSYIRNELKLFSNSNPNEIYDITLNSNYQKVVISKNTSGVATNYNISADVKVNLSLNGKVINLAFNENINIKNNSNSFEQNNYEKSVKRNFASSIREKLIIKILELNDN
jgi:outer membrane lipopolysaccharide assembly protein LptE/RlpB